MNKTDKQLKIFQAIVHAALEGAGMMSQNLQCQYLQHSLAYDKRDFFDVVTEMNHKIDEINQEPETK